MKREVGGGIFQRNVHSPDRSNQRNNRNLSNNSRIGKLKKSPISNSHLNTSNNSRIKRNLSEDKIIPKNGNYVNGSKINPAANNNYNRHHYNKTPSPIRKKKSNLSTSNISTDNRSQGHSNASFTHYASNSQCIHDNKQRLQASNTSTQNPNHNYNSGSNYKFSKALDGIETEINSIYSKNIKQNVQRPKNPVNSNLNMRTSTHYEYGNPYSNSYCSSSGSGINNKGRGYHTSKNNYANNNYMIPHNSSSTKGPPINKISCSPLVEKTNSFLEENEKLYYSNIITNKDKYLSNSQINYGSCNIYAGNYSSSSVSRGNKDTHSTGGNTFEDSKSGKNLETIEEVHIAFVNMIQSSKRLMQNQENQNDALNSLKMGSIGSGTVIKVEEKEII